MDQELTRRERQIVDILYRLGEATANDVQAELPDQPANTTVRTLLKILESKGVVTHRREGKQFIYRPAVTKKKAAKSALRRVIDIFFGGSVEQALAAHLADPNTRLDAEQWKRLKQLIDEHEHKD